MFCVLMVFINTDLMNCQIRLCPNSERCLTPMRLSRYFLPILRETPKEAEIVSHRLMLRAGMIRQEAAGIYAWLPLGLRVLQQDQRRSSARSRTAPARSSS